jgi:hypothetical protein
MKQTSSNKNYRALHHVPAQPGLRAAAANTHTRYGTAILQRPTTWCTQPDTPKSTTKGIQHERSTATPLDRHGNFPATSFSTGCDSCRNSSAPSQCHCPTMVLLYKTLTPVHASHCSLSSWLVTRSSVVRQTCTSNSSRSSAELIQGRKKNHLEQSVSQHSSDDKTIGTPPQAYPHHRATASSMSRMSRPNNHFNIPECLITTWRRWSCTYAHDVLDNSRTTAGTCDHNIPKMLSATRHKCRAVTHMPCTKQPALRTCQRLCNEMA